MAGRRKEVVLGQSVCWVLLRCHRHRDPAWRGRRGRLVTLAATPPLTPPPARYPLLSNNTILEQTRVVGSRSLSLIYNGSKSIKAFNLPSFQDLDLVKARYCKIVTRFHLTLSCSTQHRALLS